MTLLVHAAEKLVHERGAVGRETPSCCSQHPLRNRTQLDQIFPVGGVLLAVGGSAERGLRRIVKFRTDAAGKVKRASNADRPDGIQLVGIVDNFF